MSNEDPSEYENSDKEEVQKTNRDDTGVTTEDQSTGAPRIIQIPSLLTNSMRVILDAFGEDIIQLHAHGSIETVNDTLLDELREYNLVWEQSDRQRMVIDYEQLPGGDKESPINPLDKDARRKILSEVEGRLGPTNSGADQDLAVTSFTIRITSDRIKAITPAQTPEFDLTFTSDPVDEDIREVTQTLNASRGLYDDLGFKIRNHNLRKVVETATKYHQQVDGKYMSWGGPGDTRGRSPERLAVRINHDVLPDEYGFLKKYRVTEDSTLELIEDNVEELAEINPYQQATATKTGGDD